MGAQESTEEAPEGALEDGQSPGAANESKEELATPTRFRRRSRSEPPPTNVALSPSSIDLRLDEARSPVPAALRPPARVRALWKKLDPDGAGRLLVIPLKRRG